MRIAAVLGTAEPDGTPAARFADEARPLFDVLSLRARKLTCCDADAEDLLQDTLLDAYRGFHTFQEGTNVKAWLFRILYNRWVSTYRGKQRRPAEVSVEEMTERDLAYSAARVPAGLRSAETEVLEALPDSQIRAAMESLPEDFRAAVYYADIHCYTYAETAALLNIPPGTAMSRASRARQRLRTALAHLDHNRSDVAALEQQIA
ncbi:sigma-70 family RNA polymerase sigma factor [Mycobacterium cookii]|uniref:RNA polymerase sigma factor n=1 Tax=Mycobacterium cookii TaxID=1775 RepID=A0A7I7KV65_9MYCO|nr:sigma-70 family RNA polymerase sigma factor [Mycobacterium cookii]MCV7328714.1 sigma-70 family RNA polymerase sigma factor [Mycobacterium cookii]BBX45338.1 RNA polymerase sigma factor [Mycobacterium cookii]